MLWTGKGIGATTCIVEPWQSRPELSLTQPAKAIHFVGE